MQPLYVAVWAPILQRIDAMASQFRRLRSRLCFFRYLSVIVPQGYLQVACNSSMGRVWPSGCDRFFAINRRLGCRIASKQLWPSACSLLSQHVANKKKLFLLKSQLWSSNQLLNTKIPSERAFGPVPNHLQTRKFICFTLLAQLFLRPNSTTVNTPIISGKPLGACVCSHRSGIRYLAEIENQRYISKNSTQYFYYSICRSNILRRLSWLYIRNPFVPSALLPSLVHVHSPNRCQSHPNRFLTSMVTLPAVLTQMGGSLKLTRLLQSRQTLASRPNVLMATSLGHNDCPAYRQTVTPKAAVGGPWVITRLGLRGSPKAVKTLDKWRGDLSCPSATMPKTISSRTITNFSEGMGVC